jgi:hypothetical protein
MNLGLKFERPPGVEYCKSEVSRKPFDDPIEPFRRLSPEQGHRYRVFPAGVPVCSEKTYPMVLNLDKRIGT